MATAVLVAAVVAAAAARADSWYSVNVMPDGRPQGQHNSAAIVGGRPAFAVVRIDNVLLYGRSIVAEGDRPPAQWYEVGGDGAQAAAGVAASQVTDVKLLVLGNGMPAVSFRDAGKAYFVEAMDVDGAAWHPIEVIVSGLATTNVNRNKRVLATLVFGNGAAGAFVRTSGATFFSRNSTSRTWGGNDGCQQSSARFQWSENYDAVARGTDKAYFAGTELRFRTSTSFKCADTTVASYDGACQNCCAGGGVMCDKNTPPFAVLSHAGGGRIAFVVRESSASSSAPHFQIYTAQSASSNPVLTSARALRLGGTGMSGGIPTYGNALSAGVVNGGSRFAVVNNWFNSASGSSLVYTDIDADFTATSAHTWNETEEILPGVTGRGVNLFDGAGAPAVLYTAGSSSSPSLYVARRGVMSTTSPPPPPITTAATTAAPATSTAAAHTPSNDATPAASSPASSGSPSAAASPSAPGSSPSSQSTSSAPASSPSSSGQSAIEASAAARRGGSRALAALLALGTLLLAV